MPAKNIDQNMLLDRSGPTREKRVKVQASINNERDCERVAETLIIQYPRIHLRESQKHARGTASNEETIRTFIGVAEKAKVKTLAMENLETRYMCPLRELHIR